MRKHLKLYWTKIVSRVGVLLSFLLLIGTSCQGPCKHKAYTLYYDEEQSTLIDSAMLLDRVSLEYSQDRIIVRKHFPNTFYFEVHFVEWFDNYYEIRSRSDDYGKKFGTEFLLTLSLRDTTFSYKSAREFPSTPADFSYGDNKYVIKREGDGYVSIKQSTDDTTFTERFYYNKDFRINRYVVTFRDNELVYEMRH